MRRSGFAVLEIFLVAFAITVIAYLFEVNRGSDQREEVRIAQVDNVSTDNTGKRLAPFKVWIEKREAP